MTPDGAAHERIKEAFSRAVALDGGEREAFLSELDGDEPEVAREVRSLLDHHAPSDTFLENPVVGALADDQPSAEDLVGTRIGRFTITGLIAAGGMGAVYEARQDEPKRLVALKVLRAGALSRHALRRFRYESEVLGRLRHPAVAEIYEAGTHAEGGFQAPYFAMELVPSARAITEYARDEGLGLRARLELFCAVCDAVHHGHQKGVIHRDIKPANVLVDPAGSPKVIDFGVARAVEAEGSLTLHTGAGNLVGTLQYMSPEQLRPSGEDVDTRTDVYALGVVLFELVCDRPPHDLDGLSMLEAADRLRSQAPPRAGAVTPAARGDVETIIGRALEPSRERRYQSAAELAEDLRRHLRHEPILARPPGLWRQLALLARRHKPTVAAAGVVAAALVVATAISLSFAVDAHRARAAAETQRAEAQRAAGRAEQITTLLEQLIEGGDPMRSGRQASVASMLDAAAARLNAGLAADPLVEASLRHTIGSTYTSLSLYRRAEPVLRRALEIRAERLGEDDPRTIETTDALARALVGAGDLGEADRLARRAYDTQVRRFGASSAEAAASLATLGEIADRQGLPALAERRYAAAVETFARENEAARALEASLARLDLLIRLSRFDEASDLQTDLRRRHVGRARGPSLTARRLDLLAGESLLARDQPRRAAALLQRVAENVSADAGGLHPIALRAAARRAEALARAGGPAEAERALLPLIAAAGRALGEENPDVAELRLAHARVRRAGGDLEQAATILREVIADLSVSAGADQPRVVLAAIELLAVMLGQGRVSAAETLASETARAADRLFPDGSVHTARVRVLRARALVEDGRSPDAAPILRDAVEALAAQLGPASDEADAARALLDRVSDGERAER